jgi:hypothetical protein
MIAEATARELGQLSLEEALQLGLLYAAYEPAKLERAALAVVCPLPRRGQGRVAAEGAACAHGTGRASGWGA